MKEIKNIKVRSDMYYDTKFRVIDTKPLRDTIHYIWMRLLTLAAIVNKNGELYFSENIPYTIETLALEFNRDVESVKMSLEVLMELEMILLSKHNVYVVKNFMKHQNIKTRKEEKKNDENNVNIEDNKLKLSDIKELSEKDQISEILEIEDSKEENKDITIDENINNQNTQKEKNKKQEKEYKRNKLKDKQKNQIIAMEDEEEDDQAIFWDDPRYAEGGELVAEWIFQT